LSGWDPWTRFELFELLHEDEPDQVQVKVDLKKLKGNKRKIQT
jgi:hypothetical protein